MGYPAATCILERCLVRASADCAIWTLGHPEKGQYSMAVCRMDATLAFRPVSATAPGRLGVRGWSAGWLRRGVRA